MTRHLAAVMLAMALMPPSAQAHLAHQLKPRDLPPTPAQPDKMFDDVRLAKAEEKRRRKMEKRRKPGAR